MLDKLLGYYQRSNKKDSLPCNSILGSDSRVKKWASFFVRSEEEIATVAAVHLLDFIQKENFTEKEIAAYKQGLSVFPAFLEGCDAEADIKKRLDKKVKSMDDSDVDLNLF